MNNRKLVQDTFSNIRLSDEKRKELINMEKTKKQKRKLHVTKAAAASIAMCIFILAGGTITYAVGGNKVFNDFGHWLKCTVTLNGRQEDAQISAEKDGTFTITYGTSESGGQVEIDGRMKNTTCMLLELTYKHETANVKNGSVSKSVTLQIDETLSHESQVWQIRQQLIPIQNSDFFTHDSPENYVNALIDAAQKLEGVWKEGLLCSAEDIRKVAAGRKIAIDDYKFDKNPDESTDGISWLFIDYTDVKTDEHGNAEFKQMSEAGYITEFFFRIEDYELREWGPVELFEQDNK